MTDWPGFSADADDYMERTSVPAGSEVETVTPLSRTRVEMRGDDWIKASVVRRAVQIMDEIAADLRAERAAIAAGDTDEAGVLSRLLDYAEAVERVSRETMQGIDGEERPEDVGQGGGA